MSLLKYLFSVFIVLLLWQKGNAQGYGDKWVIGTPNVLATFEGDTIHLTNFDSNPDFCKRNFDVEAESICDRNGNVQFYHNGYTITSFKTKKTMENGDSLDCCFSRSIYYCSSGYMNASVILPSSIDSNKYLIFQTNVDTLIEDQGFPVNICHNLLCHTIDMSANNGAGKVILKNQIQYSAKYLLTRLAAVKHGNGRDWWLVGQGYNGSQGSNTFYIWLVANDKLQAPIIQKTGSVVYWKSFGKTTFSPDGSRLAMFTADDTLNVFDFDRCTGVLSNARKAYINDSIAEPNQSLGRSCSFSASGRFVYTSGNAGKICQFDMNIPNLQNSMIVVGQYEFGRYCYYPTTDLGMGTMQLAPDGKIYISAKEWSPCMHIINYPEVKGIGCGFVQNAFPIYQTNINVTRFAALPNHPNYKLGACSACDTITSIVNGQLITDNVKVFPNPSNGEFIINYDLKQIATAEVYNLLGQKVSSAQLPKGNNQTGINISGQPQGVYLVVIKTSNGEVFRQKIVVQRQ